MKKTRPMPASARTTRTASSQCNRRANRSLDGYSTEKPGYVSVIQTIHLPTLIDTGQSALVYKNKEKSFSLFSLLAPAESAATPESPSPTRHARRSAENPAPGTDASVSCDQTRAD